MYQGIQCYPEFLLYYERVNDDEDNVAAHHLDDAEPAPTKQNDGHTPEIAIGEAESQSLRIEQLRQQLAEQKTRRAAAELKQKQLQEELKKEQEEVIALESKSREPDACMSCCRRPSQEPKRLTQRYIRSDIDDIDGDWSD